MTDSPSHLSIEYHYWHSLWFCYGRHLISLDKDHQWWNIVALDLCKYYHATNNKSLAIAWLVWNNCIAWSSVQYKTESPSTVVKKIADCISSWCWLFMANCMSFGWVAWKQYGFACFYSVLDLLKPRPKLKKYKAAKGLTRLTNCFQWGLKSKPTFDYILG